MDTDRVADAIRVIIEELGDDPTRDGLKDTPQRAARFWRDFSNYDPGNTDTTFEAVTTDQLVVVSGITVWSLCEHHLLPFSATVDIAYIVSDRVLGLSKFARLAHEAAHRLQLQERLVHDIADSVTTLVGPDVAVHATGHHLCMTMRGIRTPANMTTSVLRGAFRDNAALRLELLNLISSR